MPTLQMERFPVYDRRTFCLVELKLWSVCGHGGLLHVRNMQNASKDLWVGTLHMPCRSRRSCFPNLRASLLYSSICLLVLETNFRGLTSCESTHMPTVEQPGTILRRCLLPFPLVFVSSLSSIALISPLPLYIIVMVLRRALLCHHPHQPSVLKHGIGSLSYSTTWACPVQ